MKNEEQKVMVYIPFDEKQQNIEDQFITVTINGFTSQIRCGEPVEIPISVYEAIKQSGKYQNI